MISGFAIFSLINFALVSSNLLCSFNSKDNSFSISSILIFIVLFLCFKWTTVKADIVINELEGAIENLEIKQRKAQTFFGKINDADLKDQLSYKFDKKDKDSYYRSGYDRGITPSDCRDQLREWAQYLAKKEAEKTPEGKKVKELELYKQSAINSVFECGVPEQLNAVLEKVLSGVGIVWNKTKALAIENKQYN